MASRMTRRSSFIFLICSLTIAACSLTCLLCSIAFWLISIVSSFISQAFWLISIVSSLNLLALRQFLIDNTTSAIATSPQRPTIKKGGSINNSVCIFIKFNQYFKERKGFQTLVIIALGHHFQNIRFVIITSITVIFIYLYVDIWYHNANI